MRRALIVVVAVLGLDLLVAGATLMADAPFSAGIALAGGGVMVILVALFGVSVE